MPDTVFGLPVHPLVVHGAIVLVPVAALMAIVVAASPDRRARLGWLAWLLTSAALGAVLAARMSGLNLEDALYPEIVPPLVADHKQLGLSAIWFALALWLSVSALLLLDFDRRRRNDLSSPWLPTVLAVVTIMAAMAASAQILWTGWSGTKSHWQTTAGAQPVSSFSSENETQRG